ncbi:protocatechuate 3,4-dioxygenase [Streptomyces stelliscabiei]|uniref:Protocatechuate 4,5-dioxygenase beta chain n=1 Tax=Streptomyces stelliscabiei TaxID=146820 RepID=A0A8I0TPF3_9ACTN|nr:protocatechuate 3,4-dioxygenase [Streptomyces stelliscabiei]MBE1595282.1 protocatechuate 4,5-dioxygenase beta chain [Streptomyces stelliscabiei]SOD80778.1 protocatechuate 4,5-dioxygenase beta subunit [Streptomyces sp. 1222.2]
MAEVIWGLATSHVPSIGAAMDRGKTEDPYWRPLFDGYAPARAWMARHTPDVAVVVYNDHANAVDMSVTPTFAVGAAASYEVADEGWGSRPVPTVVGAPEFSDHLIESLVDSSFDITVFQDLAVDHGLTVPLSVYCPDPGESWPCAVVPLLVNVIQYPQPTAARCLALGRALGEAIRSYPEDLKVAVFGTGGMSHQLAGARAGLINQDFDRMYLDAIEHDPEKLAALTREDYIREAGSEGIELIMWLIMRGALGPRIRRVHDAYHVPASNTAAGMVLFENRPLPR